MLEAVETLHSGATIAFKTKIVVSSARVRTVGMLNEIIKGKKIRINRISMTSVNIPLMR